jgi:hypothetical protein
MKGLDSYQNAVIVPCPVALTVAHESFAAICDHAERAGNSRINNPEKRSEDGFMNRELVKNNLRHLETKASKN